MHVTPKFFIFLLFFANTAWAQPSESEWKLGYIPKIVAARQKPCYSASCKKQIQQPVLLRVCLNRDKSTSGLFKRGDWKAAVGPSQGETCQELLFADVSTRMIYLEAPLMKSTGSFLDGQHYIHCAPGDQHGEHDLCASDFFVPYGANERYRILRPAVIAEAVKESGLVGKIEQYQVQEQKRKADESLKIYRGEFAGASTLASIESFESKYRDNDPDNLIGQLSSKKSELKLEAYRTRYSAMRDINEMESFIADYADDDPEKKIPAVRQRLGNEQSKAKAEAKRAAEQKSAIEKKASIDELERQIVWCQKQTVAARKAIARENQIGTVSGYVNKLALRQAGEIIVGCEEALPERFAEYRRLGGHKALADFK